MKRWTWARISTIGLAAAIGAGGVFGSAIPAGADAPAGAIVAPGDPPLTEGFVERFTQFESWLLEAPLTPEQRAYVRAMLVRDWAKPDARKSDLEWVNIWRGFMAAPSDDQEFLLVGLQAQALQDARASAAKDPDSKWLVSVYDAAQLKIADGSPALTEAMAEHYWKFVSWMFEIPMSVPFFKQKRASLIADWKNPNAMRDDLKLLSAEVNMARFKYGQDQRDYARAVIAAHRPVAGGTPPLTPQAADAYSAFVCFKQFQTGGPRCQQAQKETYARELANTFPTFPPALQREFAEIPQLWALTRIVWLVGPESTRAKLRAEWRPQETVSTSDPRWVAADNAATRVNALLKRNIDTVTDQELLAAAKDCDTVVREYRRVGTPGLLQNAESFEKFAVLFRQGKAAYVARETERGRQAQLGAILDRNNNYQRQMRGAMMSQYGGPSMSQYMGTLHLSPSEIFMQFGMNHMPSAGP